jgi:hypothetical protein
MEKKWWQSKTIWVGLTTIAGAAAAYFSGQVDAMGALMMAFTGIVQVLQREVALVKAAKAGGPGS